MRLINFFWEQVLSKPGNIFELAQKLAERHLKACRQQVSRLDTAYKIFAAASQSQSPVQISEPSTGQNLEIPEQNSGQKT